MYSLYNNIWTKKKITKINNVTRLNNYNTNSAFHTIKLDNE